MIHYIYRIDFLCGISGRYYLGKRSTKYYDSETYVGSGNFCKSYFKKYGKDEGKTYKKTIIEFNSSAKENSKREIEIIGDKWKNDPLCMNQKPGGEGGGVGHIKRKSTLEKMRISNIKAWSSPELRAKQSEIMQGNTNGRFGKGKHSNYKGELHWNSKPVIQLSLDNEILNEFPNATYAANYLNKLGSKSNIWACCKGTRNTAIGYKWKFKTNN